MLQVSPKGKNIWGSPANDNVFQKPADALRKLFDTAKAGQHPVGMGGKLATDLSFFVVFKQDNIILLVHS